MGKIMSCWVVAGPSSRCRGRLIYEELAVAVGLPIDATKWMMKHVWNTDMTLSLEAVKQIYMLNVWVEGNPSAPIWPSFPSLSEVMVVPDTGEDARGLVASVHGSIHKSHTWLPIAFVGTSSTLRELFGLLVGLIALLQAGILSYSDEVCIQIDNFGASRIVIIGSSKRELQLLALACNQILKNFSAWRIMWAPRSSTMVVWADEISKLQDACDEELCWEVFKYLDHIWDLSPLTVQPHGLHARCSIRLQAGKFLTAALLPESHRVLTCCSSATGRSMRITSMHLTTSLRQ